MDTVFKASPMQADTFVGRKVIISQCSLLGNEYKKVTTGSVHRIIAPPPNAIKQNSETAVWIKGLTAPVILLNGEFEFI